MWRSVRLSTYNALELADSGFISIQAAMGEKLIFVDK
jgi:hypothetical protein